MKKLFLIIFAICLFFLTSCQTQEKTPAELYLASHSEQEIVDYFRKADLFGNGFDNPKDISSDDLFDFVGLFGELDSIKNYNETDKQYHIPIASVYDILDKYFIDYNLEPENCWFADYNPETQELTTPVLSFASQLADYELVETETINADNIKIHLLSSFNYDENTILYSDVYITTQIIGGQAKFTSCLSRPQWDETIFE